ncbi:MAG: helix-turn-helix transcriptional regulator [Clostridia bacterium]|nr:helix-turn-helix transcriptional regulator [Clostridia bacterium]
MNRKEKGIFQTRIRELRRTGKWTQKQMADKFCFSRTCWANYELGNRCPTMETVEKIADFFGVDIDYLMGHENSHYDTEEFMEKKMKVSQYINKDGCLNLSNLTSMDRIVLIDHYKYLVKKEETEQRFLEG